MFLFSKKHKTPISTYTDSYRPPCSVKKTIYDQGAQQLEKENKFVTKNYPVLQLQPQSDVVWDTSHFMRTGGVQRGSYTIHPEFTSEAYSALCHW
ncbi:PREDICTED: spermatid-specific manchette-related protein 1 [Charadrius vociferus]|uniref:spermatid-specific manchette-related protein 1 n=1 Tax=Charadrius vociferus TaxID=50402 RepID=UPI0005212A7D|nr:PREDICTED: spermatid-specific manchette-related protein 1 [Charadrius vociferus]